MRIQILLILCAPPESRVASQSVIPLRFAPDERQVGSLACRVPREAFAVLTGLALVIAPSVCQWRHRLVLVVVAAIATFLGFGS